MRTGAAQLRDWIDRRGLLQNEAAEVLGIHEAYISHILKGRRTPGLGRAIKIERITGIPVTSWASRPLYKKKSQQTPKPVTA